MAVKLHTDCAETKLISDVPGRVEFFHYVMEKLDQQQFGVFVIGKKLERAGGYFTEKKLVSRIVLPEGTATYDEVNNTISFTDEKSFGVFVHEASHFLHMIVDKGHYMAKPLRSLPDVDMNSREALDMSYRKNMEYEAGWRSFVYDKRFDMKLHDVIMQLNTINMGNYISESPEYKTQIKEVVDKLFNDKMAYFKSINAKGEDVVQWTEEVYNPAMTKISEIVNKYHEPYLKNLQKFSEIGDMMYHYTIDPADMTEINNIIKGI